MSIDEPVPVTVKILDKEYQVACQEHEKDSLLRSAHYLDAQMKEIRNRGKVIGSDRVAVMAALNITHELLVCQSELENRDDHHSKQIKNLEKKIESAIGRSQQLEF